MNIAIYARVSTKEQDEAQQIPAIIQGFNLDETICTIYKEEVSAWLIDKAEKRLKFIQLINDIKTKKINKLYIWDIDRLYRNRKKTREFFELCQFYGVCVFSLNQKWLNDFQELKNQMPSNMVFLIDNIFSLLLDVYAQTAEDESTKKSERVKLKIIKDANGVTRSVDGKKWGRRLLAPRVINDVLNLYNKKHSIRYIANNVYYYDKNKNQKKLSVGYVHKIIKQNKLKE